MMEEMSQCKSRQRASAAARMMPALLAVLCAGQVETLRQEAVVTLEGETHHVQGIVVEGGRLWLTSVERATARGYLYEYALPAGKRVREVEVQAGAMYHPGGISADREFLYVPVAEYRRESRSVVQVRRKGTLELVRSFEVADHIGAVAVAPDRLYGANWDARLIYEWSFEGKELRRRENTGGGRYQDMKWVEGELVASSSSGAIHWLDAGTLRLRRELAAGKTDRGVVYTNEGLAVAGRRVYLAPEDAPTRLFTFLLP